MGKYDNVKRGAKCRASYRNEIIRTIGRESWKELNALQLKALSVPDPSLAELEYNLADYGFEPDYVFAWLA